MSWKLGFRTPWPPLVSIGKSLSYPPGWWHLTPWLRVPETTTHSIPSHDRRELSTQATRPATPSRTPNTPNTSDEPPVTCHDDDPTYVPTYHCITLRDFLWSVNCSICCLEQERTTCSLTSGSSSISRPFQVSCSLVIGHPLFLTLS